MRVILLIFFSTLLLFSSELKLTQKQADFIAKKVWLNEGAGLDKYLIHWNEGEDFASLGIGHFIWFSKGHTERFREVFPMVLAFMEERNVVMPEWLNSKTPLPWNSKAEFYRAKSANSKKYRELFAFLKRTMPYQAEFMASRLSHALPDMISTIENEKKQQRIKRRFEKILYHKDGSIDERGLYILLDYTNFKGEGTLESERYKGQGWGLLQVLEHIDEKAPNKYKAFSDAAKAMLSRRIKNSPPQRGEERWRKGWNVRLDTYWR
ncbi:hypothetical protein PGH07_07245 [Sulfurovum sp. zt1-1]|uniref:Uncharacterized protein n=1 Tax=Sulfurovum zhangzhouensis TaxID=3019067 RepID=A0ABT7QYP8_9BACT|nr:hypothetical protein [Sulfurovum zhangzhouensis]MDM5271969.1 hypothetical protein [Sulfurovum zhangzhouensis]